MIHAHDLQNLLLRGPRTAPAAPGAKELIFVPVMVEIRLPTGPQLIQVRAARIEDDRYILSIDGAGLVLSLAERVAGQSEALGKRAEKTLKMREGSGY